MNFAEIYTDGSCHTQKRVGAWAAVVLVDSQKNVLSGTEADTTHNRMEILSVINSIKFIQLKFPSVQKIKIISDSQYFIGLIGREAKFTISGFTTKSGKDIRNIDLVKELLLLASIIKVEFFKIKTHQKATDVINYNIEVDKLSRQLVRESVKQI